MFPRRYTLRGRLILAEPLYKNKMNNYLKDAQLFLKKASLIISKDIGEQQIIDATLFFALGIERLLKSILWDINPIYVLKEQQFKNTAPVLYKEKLLPNNLSNKEFSINPDSDVLTYRISLLRAKEFSTTTAKHFNTLFALSNYRDIIVHRPLNELDIDKLKKEYFWKILLASLKITLLS